MSTNYEVPHCATSPFNTVLSNHSKMMDVQTSEVDAKLHQSMSDHAILLLTDLQRKTPFKKTIFVRTKS
jgi:hypothetical protein